MSSKDGRSSGLLCILISQIKKIKKLNCLCVTTLYFHFFLLQYCILNPFHIKTHSTLKILPHYRMITFANNLG